MATPFATAEDVQARWRPLTDAEYLVADTLTADASDMIRVRWPDVDDRITAGSLDADSVLRVVANMVRRSMLVGDNEGWESRNESAGPFSHGGKLANPNGNLYFTADEIRLFDGSYTRRSLVGWLI